MDVGGIKEGDIVECDVRGDRFYGMVERRVEHSVTLGRRVLTVNSLTSRPIPTRLVTPRQIKAHWRRSRRGATHE